ncbi:hypothetical protein KIN20_034537 [Parelaphostrongylus tenuis]|uniref:Uncharacterized protein n=1 Tax=Parelaphostrongylus tenuis TaxID=148309 RepID=A0AAD5RAB5_PARTN|nr:hypothetical protein KIN20_034537 [Parelaphostrongylus tenuis]
MERLSILLISLLAKVAIVFECGVIPQGQATTRNFTVSGFKLPTTMVHTASTSAHAQLSSGIATTSGEAKSFVSRLVMQTITAVLEQQGRSAGLSDVIISSILSQLTVQIDYEPLKCMTVTINPSAAMEYLHKAQMAVDEACLFPGNVEWHKKSDKNYISPTLVFFQNERSNNEMLVVPADVGGAPLPHCIVVGNTMTALCTMTAKDSRKIEENKLTTTNIIMANWSKEMWQRIVNRAVRMLELGPFASHFASAFATVA